MNVNVIFVNVLVVFVHTKDQVTESFTPGPRGARTVPQTLQL